LVGAKPNTAADVVRVREHSGIVEIKFASIPFIGNFAQVKLTIDPGTINGVEGSHSMDGEASTNGEPAKAAVRLITIVGSRVNRAIGKQKGSSEQSVSFEALVLFSLNPIPLLTAAQNSHGDWTLVQKPIQLIIFGPIETE
jgi:hypothetical protein